MFSNCVGYTEISEFSVRQILYSETDHTPLLYLNKTQYHNGRLMRWALTLQQYQFTVRVMKVSDNVGADFLSRHTNDTF